MLKNPICPDVYFSDGVASDVYQQYRRKVLALLPKLMSLDATDVGVSEKLSNSVHSSSQAALAALDDPFANVASFSDASKRIKPASFLGKGRVKYDGRQSEGNRFIGNSEL